MTDSKNTKVVTGDIHIGDESSVTGVDVPTGGGPGARGVARPKGVTPPVVKSEGAYMNRMEVKKIMPTGYPQWDIYKVVREAWAPYREMTVVSAEVSQDVFIKSMQYSQYVSLDVKSAAGVVTRVVILNGSSDGSSPIADAVDKFRTFHNTVRDTSNPKMEIIIISPNRFSPHIVSYISDNKLDGTISRFDWNHFRTSNIYGKSIHTVVDEKEEDAICKQHHTSKKDINPIYTSDPAIEWLGAKEGRLILIERITENGGKGTALRRVVRVNNL